MLSPNQRLRDFAARLLDAVRIDKRAQLYKLPDGKTAMIRTSIARNLMVDGSLFVRNTDFIAVVMPTEAGVMTRDVEVYLIPTAAARQAYETAQADWHATDPDTNGATMEALYFDPRSHLVGSQQDYATQWAQYKLSNCRAVGSPGLRLVSDGVLMSSPSYEGLVELLRQQAMMWSPSISIEDYMGQVAARIAGTGPVDGVEPWDRVRCDTAEHFINDMMANGAISELIKREYEWIAL